VSILPGIAEPHERYWAATGGPRTRTTRREKLITRKSQNGASNNIAIFSVLQTAHTIMPIIVS
jgi:hypothetical protein